MTSGALAWLVPALAYALAALWFWRQFAWRIAWKQAREWSHPGWIDGGNVATGILLGFVQSCLWPLTLLLVRGVETEAFYGFLREPGVSRRRREAQEREKRISELEREVGLR